jgi:hypothetical protein
MSWLDWPQSSIAVAALTVGLKQILQQRMAPFI